MEKFLEEYKTYLSDTTSENTVCSYMSDLEKFLRENGIHNGRDLKKIQSQTVENYVAKLKNKGMAYSTITRIVASLRKFFLYCKDKKLLNADFTEGITLPKVGRKLPDIMTYDEVVRLLEAPDLSTAKGMRDKAMLEIMYATGAKVSEIINLTLSDISLKNEIVIIYNGDKHRYIPLGQASIEATAMYLKNARDTLLADKSEDALFLNVYGKPMTRQGFWKIIKQYIAKCEIGANITPRSIRHSFALHLLKNGADAESVSEMLGYSDVSSTKIYIDVMNDKIKEVYKTAHPRA